MYSTNEHEHSNRVQRTSDVPVEPKGENGTTSERVKRTSDLPVTKLGQGIRGNHHEIASTGATGGTGSQGHGR
jgi:hypothetical protein